nr:immunoglobulin light chain junction region [Macaca mulatta]
CQQYHNSPLTF